MIKKIIVVSMLLMISLTVADCYAQKDNLKSFLFLSVFRDELIGPVETSADIIDGFSRYYKNFSYDCTKPLVVPVDAFCRDSLSDFDEYVIQLFRIPNGPNMPSYYVLKMNPCCTYRFSISDTLWLRISGYRESDVKIFFDALRDQGLNKKDIKSMINLWCGMDEMFSEIDWTNILKGYYKNDTRYDCYISSAYLLRCAQCKDLNSDIHAVFSKITLAGALSKHDKY